ncbi:2OG-Fe(II) oxygenase [Synechococcus phage S-SSM5]|uniref:2OG-Fe(II) oxygenase n=1 Tax=Synechococcus phage S-SSM5 TaxID=445685 RepID=E3SK82_9CAUD|nr:2OG-Fe(II) oxygenase [Synechococcus phage S-SSM5]ADO98028.1 2OG-Fe(II) oxygenase [Synechococcus phage S-SSM5]
MTWNTMWYDTQIPEELVSLIERECVPYDEKVDVAQVREGVSFKTRDSQTSWIPATNWVGGFCMSYVLKANRENYQYDIEGIDQDEIQYTVYEKGQYYNWHQDATIESVGEDNKLRKLSFILQLSSPDEYQGGNIEMKTTDDNVYLVPRRRGTLIVFDSRTIHRVTEVTGGIRKTLVGWVTGPRWK